MADNAAQEKMEGATAMAEHHSDEKTETRSTQTPAEKSKREAQMPEAAKRALAEAKARREAIDAKAKAMPKEVNGRGGLEPTRYGDWETKGIAVDF